MGLAPIIFAVSLWRVVRLTVNRIREKTQFQKAIIRPLLVIFVIIVVLAVISASRRTSDEFGRHIANTVQKQCKENGKCSKDVSGFECDPCSGCMTSYGEYGAKFQVRYMVSEDELTFSVMVVHDTDAKLIIEGGVTVEVSEELFFADCLLKFSCRLPGGSGRDVDT